MARIGFTPAVVPLRTLNPANDTVQAGRYLATLLSTVDTDLAPANIKETVNIFGKVGTYEQALAEDVKDTARSDILQDNDTSKALYYREEALADQAEYDMVSLTQTYDTASMAVAAGFFASYLSGADNFKLRLYMEGVLVAESAFIANTTSYGIIGTRALSGAGVICKLSIKNDSGGAETIDMECDSIAAARKIKAHIGVGSIKKA